ncbi:MAG: phage tail family protein [Patescibacteria group bacterium]|nr:phage tail family protein [Patescibacteria group bacterium]MCL5432312.1 phage tail family protein [Patescibacteria group bacterium]
MITSVTLGNNQLTGAQVFCTAIRNAGFPGVAYTRTKRGGYQGSKLVTPTFVGYKIELEWKIIGVSFSDLATQRENFINALGLVHSQGSQTLIIAKSNGIQVQADVKAIDVTADLDTDNLLATNVLTEMEIEYPLLQSTQQNSQDVLIFSGGGVGVPMKIPMDMSVGGTNLVTITNNGNYAAYPVFTLVGKLTNPAFTNLTTGKQLSLNYSPADNTQSIVIDTYARTVLLQPSGNNGRQYVSGDFWTIAKGNNVLQLGNANQSDSGKVTITWRDAYLGI